MNKDRGGRNTDKSRFGRIELEVEETHQDPSLLKEVSVVKISVTTVVGGKAVGLVGMGDLQTLGKVS